MQEFRLNITTDIAGNDIAVAGYTFGTGSPRVYIQGGVHGGEVTFWIFKKLFEYLSKAEVQGTVTLVPVSNPVSWNQRTYFYTVGKFSLQTGEDWNRGFPGNQTSLAKRRADKVFSVAKTYDYVIDLHTSRKSIPFGIFIKERLDPAIVKLLGMEYNYLLSNTADDSMMSALSNTSTCGFEIECGSHDSFDAENVELVYANLINFLAGVDVVRAGKPISKSVNVFDTYIKYFANQAGFLMPQKKVGDTYAPGDRLFTVSQVQRLGEENQYIANEAGVVIKQIPSTILWEGDEVLQTVSKDNLRKL